MLGKLIKHEWRAVWKVPGFVNLFLLLYTFAGILSLHSSIWESDNKIIETLLILATFFYFISIIVISFIVMVYITVRFFKNIYTDEGYLMHTLPVSQKGLLFSKLLVSFTWMLITGVVIFISIFSIVLTSLSIGNNGIPISKIWDRFIFPSLQIFLSEASAMLGISIFHIIMLSAVMVLVGIIFSILMIYTSISLGQLFQKHKIFGSFLGYIGLHAGLQTLNSLAMVSLMSKTFMMVKEVTGYMLNYTYFTLCESIVLCIVFFFLTEYLMKKKLNLD